MLNQAPNYAKRLQCWLVCRPLVFIRRGTPLLGHGPEPSNVMVYSKVQDFLVQINYGSDSKARFPAQLYEALASHH